MPGLLQTPTAQFGEIKFVLAAIAEFLGTMMFTFAGTTTPTGVTSTQQSVGTNNAAAANWAPWGNGITLAVLIYCTANISGGHLNPAVTAATMITGHMPPGKGLIYILAQLTGACCGIMLVAGLVPGVYIGMGNSGVGCFHSGPGITLAMLFGWELVMTFILVSVVYAVAVGEPSFGNTGPLAVGLTLFAMVFAGSQYTGTAINPARAFGPAAVYHCHWDQVWLYAIAEVSGGIMAGLTAGPLYGVGAPWLKNLLPWSHPNEHPEGPSGTLVVEKRAAREAARAEKRANANGAEPNVQPKPKQARLPGLFQNRTDSHMVADDEEAARQRENARSNDQDTDIMSSRANLV